MLKNHLTIPGKIEIVSHSTNESINLIEVRFSVHAMNVREFLNSDFYRELDGYIRNSVPSSEEMKFLSERCEQEELKKLGKIEFLTWCAGRQISFLEIRFLLTIFESEEFLSSEFFKKLKKYVEELVPLSIKDAVHDEKPAQKNIKETGMAKRNGGCLIPAILSILTAVLTTMVMRGWL